MDSEDTNPTDTTLEAQQSEPETERKYDYDATWGLGDETMRLPR